MLVASSTKYTPLRLGVTTSPKSAPLPGGEPLVVEPLERDLRARRRRFDDPSIPGVDREDVAVRRERQAERRVEPAVAGDVGAGERRAHPGERIRDRGDAIVGGVCDEERSSGVQRVTCRPDDQRSGIGSLRETRADDRARHDPRCRTSGRVEHEPNDRAAVDHCAAGRDRAVEHVGHEDDPSWLLGRRRRGPKAR